MPCYFFQDKARARCVFVSCVSEPSVLVRKTRLLSVEMVVANQPRKCLELPGDKGKCAGPVLVASCHVVAAAFATYPTSVVMPGSNVSQHVRLSHDPRPVGPMVEPQGNDPLGCFFCLPCLCPVSVFLPRLAVWFGKCRRPSTTPPPPSRSRARAKRSSSPESRYV